MKQIFAFLSIATLMSGCASAPGPVNPGSSGAIVPEAPEKTVFIRASFDDDPSQFLGRFLPDELAPDAMDENSARVSSRCARFLSSRTVNASGTFEQTFNASGGVKGSLGVKSLGSIGGASTSDAGLLVKYAMAKKMVVTVADPDGFAQCCEAAPGECSSRMIGEFWYGTGTVSQFAGRQDEVDAKFSKGTVDAEIGYKDGWAWKRVSTFENAYFAFRTVAGPQKSQVCQQDWVREPPRSLDGQYFIGSAAVLAPEPKAREEAMRNARREVVKFLGERITEAYAGASSSIDGAIADQTLVTAAADGVARRVKDRCWGDVRVRQTPDGPYTEIRVLAFLPSSELEAAKVEVVDAMADAAEKQDKPAAAKLRGLASRLRR